ncbi:MAG: type II/IV secretion system ATPase subunit [Thermoplasmata archaeon]
MTDDPNLLNKLYEEAMNNNPHLKTYVTQLRKSTGKMPAFYVTIPRHKYEKIEETGIELNLIYPVDEKFPTKGPIFIHITKDERGARKYIALEPTMNAETMEKYHQVMDLMLKEAPYEKAHETQEEFEEVIERLVEKVTTVETEKQSFFSRFETKKVKLTPQEVKDITYFIKRNIMWYGPLEPLIRDRYLEEIHSVGTDNVSVYHKIFGMIQTNVKFFNEAELDNYLRNMSERIGRPVSDAKPIVDGTLPDGSRINIVYSTDVSKEGSSFTIRKFPSKPLTVVQLVAAGTFSPQIAAYLWLCLENGMNVVVSGETASGKTTTLNALLNFINHNSKVYSAEDTPEVIAPQPVWQRLVTRDSGPEESRVDLFELVKAALRSRPNYIIVGEVRGKEGFTAFPAMQTGHSVMTTFHAPSVKHLIQRFTGDPINVPIRFMDNLNLCVFQRLFYKGEKLERRVTSVDEIIRYSKELNGVLHRSVFVWDEVREVHCFRGMNNSYILEEKIAPKMKFTDRRDIYKELENRAKVISELIDKNLNDYDTVTAMFCDYYKAKIDTMKPEVRFSWWERRIKMELEKRNGNEVSKKGLVSATA